MKESIKFKVIQQVERRLSNLIWQLLRNSSLNTGTYIAFMLLDFIYQLCIFLDILFTQGCLPFEFKIFESLFDAGNTEALSIASICFAIFIVIKAIILVGLALRQDQAFYQYEYAPGNHNYLFGVFSLILAIFKTFGFTFFLQILFNEIVQFNNEAALHVTAFAFSLTGLILLLLIQCLQLVFFTFPFPQEQLPWIETSFGGPLTETSYKVLLVICFQFRENRLSLFILIAVLLLIESFQIFNRMNLCFLINPLAQRVSLLCVMINCHFLFFLLLCSILSENHYYFYVILILMPVPLGSWYICSNALERDSVNILNAQIVKKDEVTTIVLINLVRRFSDCEKGVEDTLIGQLNTLHSVVCPKYFLRKQKQFQQQIKEAKDSEANKPVENDPVLDMTATVENCNAFEIIRGTNPSVKKKEAVEVSRGGKSKKKYLQIAKHIFRDHIQFDSVTAFSILLLQVFFVLQILNNPYQAQFMVQLLSQTKKKQSFLENHQVRIVQLFVEQYLTKFYEHTRKVNKINIQKMLRIDEMTSQFESKMKKLTKQIHDFWKQLANDNQSGETFTNGIKLAVNYRQLERNYLEIINESNSKKQKEVQFKMTQFNKVVLRKEQNSEIFNRAHNQANLKFLMVKESDYKEKALMLVKFSTQHMMNVIFMNNETTDIVGFTREELLGKPVNSIMPKIVSENHHRFISNYYVTWKQRMTGSENQFFIKTSKGFLQPVLLQTFAQASKIDQMVLILESCQYQPFDKEENERPATFLLTSEDFVVQEIAYNFSRHTGIDYNTIKSLEDKFNRSVKLDDLVTLYNSFDQREILDYRKEAPANIYLRGELNCVEDQEEEQVLNKISKDVFNVILVPFSFMQGKIQVYFVSFQQAINKNSFSFSPDMAGSVITPTYMHTNGFEEDQEIQGTDQMHSESLSRMNESSQSSGNQRHFKNIWNRSMEFSSSVDKTGTPTTLRFINRISLLLILIILVAGTVTLILVLKSQEDAIVGVIVNNYALQRMNGMSQARNILRQMANIANGYQDNESEYIEDRFSFYLDLFEKGIQQIREQQIMLNEYESDSPILQPLEYSQVSLLTKNLSITEHNFTTEYATNQYINNGFSIYEKCLEQGQPFMKSDLYFFHIGMDNSSNASISATQDERTIFYVYKQSKHSLYFQTRTFAMNFYLFVRDEIIEKTKYTKILTFICITMIASSTVAVMPFFLRVQKRIQQLLGIFFLFNKAKIEEILLQIESFQLTFSSSTKKHLKKKRSSMKKLVKNKTFVEKENKKEMEEDLVNDSNRALVMEREEVKEEPSESLEENSEEQVKKVKKNKKNKEQKQDFKNQNLERNFSQHKLNLYIQKRNLVQILLITSLGLISCFFFTIQYVKCLDSFNEMDSSINSQNDIGFKDFDISGLIYAISEEHMMNTTTIVVDNYGVALSMATFLTNMFQNITADYNERVIKGQPKHLGFSLDFVNKLESSEFCDCMFGNNSCNEEITENSDYLSQEKEGVFKRMTVEECRDSGVALQGLQSVLVQIFQECQQLRIHFESAQTNLNRTVDFVKEKVRHQIARVADLYYVFGCNAISVLLNMSSEGIYDYFQTVTKHFIFIYISFLFTLACMIAYMKFYVLQNLLEEMHLSNKLLYIVDFDSLSDDEQQNILKFLKDY